MNLSLADIGLPPETKPMHGKGCEKCGGTGYKGRQGLFR